MFNSIKAANLFSWESLDYEVKDGISQITGFNFDDNTSEGSGKSSIPNILCWVLYGKIPKDVRIDEVIRDGANGGVGAVELSSGFIIFRGRRPNVLKITTPDGQDLQGKDAKETQTLINKIVGLDFEAFCQSVYFAQNYPNKFLSSNEASKAQILSEIQDLTQFDRARKKVQVLINEVETNHQIAQTELRLKMGELDSSQKTEGTLTYLIGKFEEEKEARVAQAQKLLNAMEAKVLEIRTVLTSDKEDLLIAEVERHEQMLKHLAEKLGELKAKSKASEGKALYKTRLDQNELSVKNLKNKLLKFNKNENCPTCQQPLAEHQLAEIAKEKKDLQEEIARYEEISAGLLADVQAFANSEDYSKITNEVRVEISNIEKLKVSALQELKQIEQLKRAKIERNNDFVRLTNELATVRTEVPIAQMNELEKVQKQTNILRKEKEEASLKVDKIMKSMMKLMNLKDGFKEVKSYVFQSLLEELSIKSTSFAKELFEVPINIKFHNEDDEGSVSKILTEVTLDGNTRGLGLFSGGQYRRIELSVDLALASIVAGRSKSPINFRILDEPLKDLSDSSVEKVVELLKKLEGSTILIEHNSLAKAIIGNVFNIEFRNGISAHESQTLEV